MKKTSRKSLKKYLSFFHEVEPLKKLLRHSWLSNGRQESVAEHTWRSSLMALVLYSEIGEKIDIGKVLKMLTIHDLAEIYAGDHHAFDGVLENKYELEKEALKKLLRDLPMHKRKELTEIWEEFEKKKTLESKFAQAIEKIETLIQHNDASLSTWNEKEKAFNLIYALDKCEFNPVIKKLRKMVQQETEEKLQKG